MKRLFKRWRRFSMRGLMIMVTLTAVLCWFAPRWGEVLVVLHADRILVPMGVAEYAHDPKEMWIWPLMGAKLMEASSPQRAVWISNKNCRNCHGGTLKYIAFPHRDREARE